MAKVERPAQDEGIFTPYMKKLYTATVLGRPGDREEPTKYTQALSERIHFEAQTEWLSRIHEYMHGCGVFEEMMEKIASGEETPEDAHTVFGSCPPIFALPIAASQASMSMIFGRFTDVYWVCMDEFTMENLWAIYWHIEDGAQTNVCSWYVDDEYQSLLNRRHMKTGEKFKELCIHRPYKDGVAMVRDILTDIRNEKFPDYADEGCPIYYHGYVNNATVDAQYGSRSQFELIHLMNSYICTRIGFPYQSYTCFSPFPDMYNMTLQMPTGEIPRRLVASFTGRMWNSIYTLSHLETSFEVFGEEMIPPTSEESSNSYILHGMDRIRYPPGFKQSKYVYGQDAQMRTDEYPCPQKMNITAADAATQIRKARKEHPEWLV
jgi:hypothetical protein